MVFQAVSTVPLTEGGAKADGVDAAAMTLDAPAAVIGDRAVRDLHRCKTRRNAVSAIGENASIRENQRWRTLHARGMASRRNSGLTLLKRYVVQHDAGRYRIKAIAARHTEQWQIEGGRILVVRARNRMAVAVYRYARLNTGIRVVTAVARHHGQCFRQDDVAGEFDGVVFGARGTAAGPGIEYRRRNGIGQSASRAFIPASAYGKNRRLGRFGRQGGS